jgi:hypothetical protein
MNFIEYHNPSLRPATLGGQPSPKEGNTPVILEAIKYLSDRALAGKQKHGRLLETNNGRDADLDALEESADLFMYLFQKHLENGGK